MTLVLIALAVGFVAGFFVGERHGHDNALFQREDDIVVTDHGVYVRDGR